MSRALLELATLVRRETGNELPEGRLPYLREAAERRCRVTGRTDLAEYVSALAADELPGEWATLATLLTIKESTFFRVPLQWDRIRDQLLPELVLARSGSRRLRCWSAACAAGEEPATLALVLDESPLLAGWDWRILATDLDPDALAHARRGLYGDRAVAGVPARMLATSFTRRGQLYELDPRLRGRIDYQQMNLSRLPYRLAEPAFDLILLRNVLIYFRQQLQAEVVAETARRLARPGALFLGGSETLWRVQDTLHAVDLGGCFCYRLPEDEAASGELQRGAARSRPPVSGPQKASSRNADGKASRPGTSAQRLPPATPATPLAAILPAPPATTLAPTPAERMLAAIAHLEADRLEEAAREADLALAGDPADPAAHVLSGLVDELAGRADAAADAFRAALYLDPDLPQVRFRLAHCLRRAGKPELALRQIREVVATLERGGGRNLPVLDGRLLPGPAETLRLARGALDSRRQPT
ncbi:MAG: CheR family methyltransferase [Thermoanaerobaculia bacterium]